MSQPLPPKAGKSSIFSSQPSIRIPTFQSPTVKPAPSAPIPQTRDEERQARLKGPAGAWNNLNALLPKGPQPLPSFGKRLGAPPPPVRQPVVGSPSKRRSPVKVRVNQVQEEQRETDQTTPPTASTSSRRKSKARASTTAQEQQREEEEEQPVEPTESSKAKGKRKSTSAPRRASTNKPPPASAAPTPAPAPAAKKRKSSIKPSAAPIVEVEEEHEPEQEEQPVASTSRAAKGKGKRKSAVVVEQEEEEQEESAPAKSKKPASKKRSRTEEAAERPKSKPKSSVKAASGPSKPSSSKNKRVRISDVPPPVESYDDAMASTDSEADAEDLYAEPIGMVESSEDEDSEEEGAEGKSKRKKGTKVRTERLKGNKGRLNAVDVVYGGVKKLLARKISTLAPTSRPARSLTRYSTILQTLFLTRSDQLSTLSSSSAAVSSARARARQLRTELLGVQRARSGVGKRMREEEEGWKESRKRVETTRDLHSFLNDLSSASLDWQDPPPEVDSARSPSDDFQPRLERLAALLGPAKSADQSSKKGKGKAGAKEEVPSGLVARVQRLNAELRMER